MQDTTEILILRIWPRRIKYWQSICEPFQVVRTSCPKASPPSCFLSAGISVEQIQKKSSIGLSPHSFEAKDIAFYIYCYTLASFETSILLVCGIHQVLFPVWSRPAFCHKYHRGISCAGRPLPSQSKFSALCGVLCKLLPVQEGPSVWYFGPSGQIKLQFGYVGWVQLNPMIENQFCIRGAILVLRVR